MMDSFQVILDLKKGERIAIASDDAEPVVFCVNVGDAMLNGDSDQVWLENDDSGKRQYLRRNPAGEMSIGPALFSSLADLAQTLETGDYYIA